jgi:hypothetical protein
VVLLFAGVLAAACGGGGGGDGANERGEEQPAYSGLVASSEFVVGPNRFPFGLVSLNGQFLEGANVAVRFFSLNQPEPKFLAERIAEWRTIEGTSPHAHADGGLHLHLDFQGVYVVDDIAFPDDGIWGAEFVVSKDGEEVPKIEGAAFRVLARPVAPGVGERVPATTNLTIDDVASFAEISTRQVERDELHNVSVAQALESGRPFVVFFASPQFCVSAMCGPVTDTLEQAREAIGGAIEFIHLEPWDLTEARENGKLVRAPVTIEWRLPTEPWTFVVGADGLVVARFEGLVTLDEVLAIVEPLL